MYRVASILVVTLTLSLIPAAANAQDWYDDFFFGWWDPPIIDEGMDLVGRDLNGTSLNGGVDGVQVTMVGMTSVWKDRKLHNLLLAGGRFFQASCIKSSGKGGVPNPGSGLLSTVKSTPGCAPQANSWMADVYFKALLSTGSSAWLRLESVRQDPNPKNQDVSLYKVSYTSSGKKSYLCGLDDSGNPVEAVALRGTWDQNEGTSTGGSWNGNASYFTFACVNAALGKCATNGYAPWRKVRPTGCTSDKCLVSLRNHHQACSRMMRADYCGDGTSYTVDGTDVNLYDEYEVRQDSLAWNIEGEWGADGAVCLTATRLSTVNPTCAAKLAKAGCGSTANFSSTTLLIAEFLPGAGTKSSSTKKTFASK